MKPYWKRYGHELYKRAVLAHFVVQPSRYAQQMRGTLQERISPAIKGIPLYTPRGSQSIFEAPGHLPERARLRWETGRPLYARKMRKGRGIEVIPKLRHAQRLRIIDQLADALVDHLRLGVVHNDMRPDNILVSGRDRPRIKIIDYERAQLATGNVLEAIDLYKDYLDVYHDVIPLIAGRNPKATGKLQDYFRQRFLRRVERKL